jgi:ATP-binding cassette subfamily B protein
MIVKYFGGNISIETLRQFTEIGKEGVSLLGISDAAEKIGLKTLAAQCSLQELKQDIKLPAILHWGQNHFVVLHKIKKGKFYLADPAHGLAILKENIFVTKWLSSKVAGSEKTGVALTLEPMPAFYNLTYDENKKEEKTGITKIIPYLYPYKRLIVQLLIGMLTGSLLQLLLPFLSQSIVDVGIATNDLQFIYIILTAQLALFTGRLSVDFIKAWILYHISSRINISILTNFLLKLMRLPAYYFDSTKTGDILQRMNDHQRIEFFLTGTSLSALFSVFNLILFSVVLGIYSLTIFFVFIIAAVLYALWIIIFLNRRKQLDYKQFDIGAAEQSKIMEIIQGMQEIKLHGCEKQKRWQWEHLKARGFKLGIKNLALNQWQQTGAFFINEGKNIIITFLAAKAVVDGSITLGAMVAVQYIIGQLNAPIEQLINFVQSWQLAKISLDRLNEIHGMSNEENETLNTILPLNHTTSFDEVSFKYPGAGNEKVLNNIQLTIPHGKVTAIVGTSGSGKTTLLKLLLKFYETYTGNINIDGDSIKNISHSSLRRCIGVVMQESYIFNDSIAANIAVSDELPLLEKLRHAAKLANVLDFIDSLPLGFYTKIGAEGKGMSAGQKQRILIARAIYKNPDYIFLDEATNSLDANNERQIIENLETFFQNKTVIVVAHRLSTVKHAHQIVVVKNGNIIETGSHSELTKRKGEYYALVKNQLELGN